MLANLQVPLADAAVSMRRIGCVLLTLMTAALGTISIYTGDFAYTWQPVPADLPLRALAARVTGAVEAATSFQTCDSRGFQSFALSFATRMLPSSRRSAIFSICVMRRIGASGSGLGAAGFGTMPLAIRLAPSD